MVILDFQTYKVLIRNGNTIRYEHYIDIMDEHWTNPICVVIPTTDLARPCR